MYLVYLLKISFALIYHRPIDSAPALFKSPRPMQYKLLPQLQHLMLVEIASFALPTLIMEDFPPFVIFPFLIR